MPKSVLSDRGSTRGSQMGGQRQGSQMGSQRPGSQMNSQRRGSQMGSQRPGSQRSASPGGGRKSPRPLTKKVLSKEKCGTVGYKGHIELKFLLMVYPNKEILH